MNVVGVPCFTCTMACFPATSPAVLDDEKDINQVCVYDPPHDPPHDPLVEAHVRI